MPDAEEFKFENYFEATERKKAFRSSAIAGVVFLIVAVITTVIARFNMEEGWFYSVDKDIVARWGLAIFIEVSILTLVVIFVYVNGYDKFQSRRLQAEKQHLRNKEGRLAANQSVVTFHEMWTSNNERIDLYHGIATTQSKSSFRAAQITAVIGFIMVVGLGALTVFFANGATAVAASVIAVAAAAMSGYIGATFLKAQAEASAQLRVFFAQPVELARLLSAERLLQQHIPEDQQAATVTSMVTRIVEPRSSQNGD